tara:strand:- start:5590 stop:6657 length:1068 start_codon:yes stop_codon:yes gene_type:complete
MDYSFLIEENITANFKSYRLEFRQASGTSRGVLHYKDVYFLILKDKSQGVLGIGEAGPLFGLSCDFDSAYNYMKGMCALINKGECIKEKELQNYPSVKFALEMACLDLKNGGNRHYFKSDFEGGVGIPINGLIWMGSLSFMQAQLEEKISAGFKCIKIKVGAIDFEEELSLINNLRKRFSKEKIEIRLDANGAFEEDALDKLKAYKALGIHSIEQPIRQGQTALMANLCKEAVVDIALDEELIGIQERDEKADLLDRVKPQYIILKPTLLGGFQSSQEWIELAEERGIAWWATSALESNIGLCAIAQWTSSLKTNRPQGLGTGQLYVNNINAPMEIKDAKLYFSTSQEWDLSPII